MYIYSIAQEIIANNYNIYLFQINAILSPDISGDLARNHSIAS